MVAANNCSEYFIIFEDEVLPRSSIHKIPGKYYRLTIYYENSDPENIEFDPKGGVFRDYEGAHRPTRFRPDYQMRQKDLKTDFLTFLGPLVGSPQKIQMDRGSNALNEIVGELKEIFEL